MPLIPPIQEKMLRTYLQTGTGEALRSEMRLAGERKAQPLSPIRVLLPCTMRSADIVLATTTKFV
jgi:hypothetical protein